MSPLEWFVVNMPETFVVLIFLMHGLKKEFNVLIPFFLITIELALIKSLDSGPFLSFILALLSYWLVIRKNSFTDIFKNLMVILSTVVTVDLLWVLFVMLISGKNLGDIQSDFKLYLLIVIYASMIKALVLYGYYNIRRVRT